MNVNSGNTQAARNNRAENNGGTLDAGNQLSSTNNDVALRVSYTFRY